MEILRIGDELSISGYNAITLSDNMDSNIAAFAQAMFQNGGRKGVSLTFGFRWALGEK